MVHDDVDRVRGLMKYTGAVLMGSAVGRFVERLYVKSSGAEVGTIEVVVPSSQAVKWDRFLKKSGRMKVCRGDRDDWEIECIHRMEWMRGYRSGSSVVTRMYRSLMGRVVLLHIEKGCREAVRCFLESCRVMEEMVFCSWRKLYILYPTVVFGGLFTGDGCHVGGLEMKAVKGLYGSEMEFDGIRRIGDQWSVVLDLADFVNGAVVKPGELVVRGEEFEDRMSLEVESECTLERIQFYSSDGRIVVFRSLAVDDIEV